MSLKDEDAHTDAEKLISIYLYELDNCLPFVVVPLKVLNSLSSMTVAIQVNRQ